ncbi:bifunctional oligoribonuclease/PAP phosphatase NrnA [Leptotrichia sp. OH3620_COT-345]|uniref:DHH family phosphoesterase n=1 Tax=Leptotrichia sp. OH3620_COT-345 TaxID=2491048 RepID=UPI000F652845|nr:bifunctional oligoribonuclease/PAP phosphatase NrnA [Leptotrichia sp. OH3620_COT-345]RRD39806.1 bifunctional oligoribonuclease/PAP phosphatase NrnA [Leptotrichia sp. OH3620_COT-345]
MKKKYKGNSTPEEIKTEILKAKNIILTAHINPDGDALGSVLAFLMMIEEYNKKFLKNSTDLKKVRIVIDDKLPKYMNKFEESFLIEKYDDFSMDKEADLFISLDCANVERYGRVVEIKEKCKKSINIDHHISNTEHAEMNYVEDVSSTGELLYQFLNLFNIEMTKKIANFLYLGIINDTGNFRHDNVTSETFRICSELIKAGADNHKIANIIFGMNIKKVKLFGDVYRNNVMDKEYGFIYYYLSAEKIREFEIEKDDADGIAELLLKIEKTELSLFVREEDDGILKGSLRCNDKYNVNQIAGIFNGGGHIKAAGFKTELSFSEVLEKIYEKIKEYKNK